jgi:translation initiation factor 4A
MENSINEDLTNEIEEYESFDDMGLKEHILRGLYSYGFEKPSAIQKKAIVPVIKGGDIIAQAQSGTGKTGTFVTATLERIDENLNGCQAIIVSPTRELSYQIMNVFKQIGQFTKNKFVPCVGGTNIQIFKQEMLEYNNNNPIVIIGTPGRIIDMIERRYLSTRLVKMLVLDEADEMLSSSFQVQIKSIIQSLSKTIQICLFSATMPGEVIELSKKFMEDTTHILVKQEEITLEGIRQYFINVQHERFKLETFCDLYKMISISQSMVYVNTVNKAEWLHKKLIENDFTVGVIHSKMEPTERKDIMSSFRKGETRVLISTDLLSRGIDIQQVSIVINYDIPNDKESYIHRIGRSGRYGRKGIAINFTSEQDYWKVQELEKFYQTKIEEMPSDINLL